MMHYSSLCHSQLFISGQMWFPLWYLLQAKLQGISFGGKALSISKTPSLGQTLKIELLGQRPYVFLRLLTHTAIQPGGQYQFILPPPVTLESPKVEVFWA